MPSSPLRRGTSAELGYRPIRAAAAASGGVAGFGSPLPSPSVSPTAIAAATGPAVAGAADLAGPAPPPGLPVPPLWQPMGQVAGVPIIGGMAALQPATGASGPPAADLVKAEPHAAGRPGLAAPDATFVDASADPAPVNGRKAQQPTNGAASPQSHPLDSPDESPVGIKSEAALLHHFGSANRNQHSAASGDGRAAALRDVEKAAATLATSEAAAIAAAAESQVLSGL